MAWEQVVASPAERVRRTLEASGLELDVTWDQRVYLASAASLLQVLHEVGDDARSVLLVGHNPGLQELIFELVPPEAEDALFDEAAEKFPHRRIRGAPVRHRQLDRSRPGTARLIQLARPRDLDPELGPERAAQGSTRLPGRVAPSWVNSAPTTLPRHRW